MSRTCILALLALVISAAAFPQSNEKQPQAPAPAQPAAQGQPAQPAAEGQPAQPAGQPMQAKTTAEYNAYAAAIKEPDLTKATTAAEEFQKQFPDSQVTFMLFQNLMRRYRAADNADKSLGMAQKVLSLDADNPEALITSAGILAETTHPTDLDKQQKYDQALQDAQHGLDAMQGNKMHIPATATPEQVAGYKNSLSVLAYSSMGAVNMAQENWAAAEQNLRKAVDLSQQMPDMIVLYRLALTLDKQQKYNDALGFVTQAEQLAGDSPFKAQVLQEKQRLQQLTATTPAAAPKQ